MDYDALNRTFTGGFLAVSVCLFVVGVVLGAVIVWLVTR